MLKLQSACTCHQWSNELTLIRRGIAASRREFSQSTARLEDRPQNDPPKTSVRPMRSEGMANLVRRVIDPSAKSTSQTQTSRVRPAPSTPSPAKLLKRPANLVRRSPGGADSRTGTPLRVGRNDPRNVNVGAYAARAIQQNRSGQGSQARKRRAARGSRNNDDEQNEVNEEIEAEFMDMIDPQEKLENTSYTPVPVDLESLRVDWPELPLGKMGHLETIEERLRWLSRRFPHGYDNDHEHAARLLKGELVSFQSPEEKSSIISLARQIASETAETQTEDSASLVSPQKIEYEDLSDQGKGLADHYVRGKYAGLEKQRIPLLDQVVRQLRNNETYQDEKSKRFLAKVESLIPQQGSGGGRGKARVA